MSNRKQQSQVIRIDSGRYERIQKIADERGMSVNGLLELLLDRYETAALFQTFERIAALEREVAALNREVTRLLKQPGSAGEGDQASK